MRAKQKNVHCRGPPNGNLGNFVCSCDVCRASKPFQSINYGSQTNDSSRGQSSYSILLINCKLKTNFITKCQLSYMECPLTRERKLKKNPTFHFRKCPRESVRLGECVNTEFDWEVKRGIENSVHK